MSYWAKLDENNLVIDVVVCDDNDPNGDRGYQWLIDNLGGRWVETFKDGSRRKLYAGTGFTYNEQADVFIEVQPFPSWVLNENFDWQAPTPKPNDQKAYLWNEAELSWVLAK